MQLDLGVGDAVNLADLAEAVAKAAAIDDQKPVILGKYILNHGVHSSGAGTGEEEKAYRAKAKALGVEDRIRFLGNVPHDELPKLVAAADIAILPSRSEGLANAWVEALSCGTPIIISEAGGACELVRSDMAGQIVEQDSAAIVNAIKAMFANPPAQQDVRDTVRDFSWKTNGDALVKLFGDIVKREVT